jgi:hypothetical protein
MAVVQRQDELLKKEAAGGLTHPEAAAYRALVSCGKHLAEDGTPKAKRQL